MPIQIVCAWCKKDMGTKEGETNDVSHSICPSCYKKVVAEEGLEEEAEVC
jgi:hypothetical protein